MYALCTSLIFIGLLSPLLTLSTRAAESPGVVLSEVAWGGSLRGAADEWLELANPGGNSVDLSGWSVTGAGTSGSNLTLPSGSTIPAYGTFLIANYAPGSLSTLVNQADYVTTAVSLPNTKLTLSLLDASGLVVDSLVDAGTPDYGSTTPIFSSTERNLSTLFWQNSNSSSNLLDTTQLGSPGLAAILIPVQVPIVESVIEPITEPVIETVTELISTAVPDPLITDEPVVTSQTTSQNSAPNIEVTNPVSEPSSPDFTITDTITPSIDITDPIAILEPSQSSPDISATPVDPIIVNTEPIIAKPPVETPVLDSAATIAETPIATPAIVETLIITPEPIIESPIISEPIPIVESTLEPAIESITPEPSQSLTPISQATHSPIELSSTQPISNLVLTELLPSPSTGFDEWIEVFNPNTVDMDVTNWSITDASGKATKLTGTILAGNYQTIINPSGKLNNDGDTVNLVDATGQIVDSVTYGTVSLAAPKHDVSLSRSGDTWLVSTIPTPGTENSINVAIPTLTTTEVLTITESIAVPEPSLNSTPITEEVNSAIGLSSTAQPNLNTNQQPIVNLPSTSSKSSVPSNSTSKKVIVTKTNTTKSLTKKTIKTNKKPQLITSLSDIADNTLVTYQGTVIATPGTFNKQLAVISGAMLYMNSADWPTLTLGDVITVTGLTSTAGGEQRIKLTGASAITITGHHELIPTTNLGSATEPSLVTIHGTVVTRNGSKLTLKVNGQDLTVDAYKTTGIIWSSLTSSELTITGILRHLKNEDILMPRSQTDVIQDQVATISAATNTKHSTSIPLKPLAGGGLVASSLGALGYWFIKSRTLIPAV